MRLINVKTFKLEEFLDYQAPPYAILSHTWGDDSEELNFRDVEDGNINKPGIGSVKFRECCRQAIEDKLDYAWIDTCCIDKANLVELSEAINSMFRWYQRADICYAFLSDVPGDEDFRETGSKFQRSRWFQRGWTLQELLAPKTMRFYGAISTSETYSTQAGVNTHQVQEWRLLGKKGSMSTTIASITGIPQHYLLGYAPLHMASVAQRMSWAAHRDTKRKEDLAYCLLGIFNITMPMIYGEGDEQAFFRLQEQIMKVTRDDSILAWGLGTDDSSTSDTGNTTAGRIVAKGPADFANSGLIIRRDQALKYTNSVDISGGSIRTHLPLHTTPTGQIVGLLSCGPEKNSQQVVGIPLIELSVDEYARPRGTNSSLYSMTAAATKPKPIRIKHDSQENVPVESGVLFFHYEEDNFADVDLKIIDVAPKSCWDEERTLIMSTAITNDGAMGQILIRLRHDTQESKDFVILLEYKKESSNPVVECMVLICSRNLLLEELILDLPTMRQKLDGKRQAKNESLSLSVALKHVERQPIFFISLESAPDGVFTTIDATVELKGETLMRQIFRVLDEKEAAGKESRKLEDEMDSYDENLKEVKKEQETILAKLKVLEERQKALIEKEKDYTGKQTEITTKRDEVKNKLSDLSIQWENVQKGWDTLGQDEKLRFPLLDGIIFERAVAKGLIDVVEHYLQKGTDVNALDQNGYTPLISASESRQFEVAKLLIEHGARIDAQDGEGATPLLKAVASGFVELVQVLIDKGADIEGRGKSSSKTPLLAAASTGHADVVRLLIDHGAQIEAKTGRDSTALLLASEKGHTDVVQLLLDRGADVEAKFGEKNNMRYKAMKDKSRERFTPLLVASRKGYMDIVRLLLNKGANIEAKSKEMQITPLMLASGKGHTDIVQLLLDRGADMEAKNQHGITALLAAFNGEKKDVIKLLINKGAQVDIRDEDDKTLLIRASAGGDTEIVRQLLEIGKIDLYAKDGEDRTALQWATKNGHEAIVQLLRDAEKDDREQFSAEGSEDDSEISLYDDQEGLLDSDQGSVLSIFKS
ncbi:ankyrin repeat-containing domain protein [Trichoderma sp. SZMC 28011]